MSDRQPQPPSDTERRELPDHHLNPYRAEVREHREHLASIPEPLLPRDVIQIIWNDGTVETHDYRSP